MRPTSPAVLADVAAGGALGALARYGDRRRSRRPTRVRFAWCDAPRSTSVGCALVGVLAVVLRRPAAARAATCCARSWSTGFLGGFTTFSAYALGRPHDRRGRLAAPSRCVYLRRHAARRAARRQRRAAGRPPPSTGRRPPQRRSADVTIERRADVQVALGVRATVRAAAASPSSSVGACRCAYVEMAVNFRLGDARGQRGRVVRARGARRAPHVDGRRVARTPVLAVGVGVLRRGAPRSAPFALQASDRCRVAPARGYVRASVAGALAACRARLRRWARRADRCVDGRLLAGPATGQRDEPGRRHDVGDRDVVRLARARRPARRSSSSWSSATTGVPGRSRASARS